MISSRINSGCWSDSDEPPGAETGSPTAAKLKAGLTEAGLTFFGLPGALSEEQLVLLVWEGIWEDSGHQRAERQKAEQTEVASNVGWIRLMHSHIHTLRRTS